MTSSRRSARTSSATRRQVDGLAARGRHARGRRGRDRRAAARRRRDGKLPDEAKYTGLDAATSRRGCSRSRTSRRSRSSRRRPPPRDSHNHEAVCAALVTHVERMRYRIAVLDSADAIDSGRGQAAGRDRLEARGALLPVGDGRGPVTQRRDRRCRRAGFVAGIYARNDIDRGVYKAPANEVVRRRARLREADQQRASRRCSTRGHQLPALLRGSRPPALGRPHDQLRPRVEVPQRPALLHLPGALDRHRHPVGGVRAQRRAAVGQRAAHDRGLPAQRVPDGRAARRQARGAPSSSSATARR